VNCVETGGNLIKEVSLIKTPLSSVREMLLNYDEFVNLHPDCEDCLNDPNHCSKLKECLQQLMDQGLVQVGYAKKEDLVATIDQHGHERGV
jgi:hypothetical protein